MALAPALAFSVGCTPARQTPPAPTPQQQATEPPAGVAPQVETLPPTDSDIKLTPPPGAKETVTVAFLAPLSGPNAALGQALLNAAQMALFDLGAANSAGGTGGMEISLAPRDTGGTMEGAQKAAQEAIGAGARLILGPVFSTEVQAVAPIVRARGIPLVSFSNDYTAAGDGVYIIGFTPEQQVQRVVSYAASRGLTRFAALAPESVYGNRIVAALQTATSQVNGQVTRVETYDPALTTQGVTQIIRRLASYDQRHGALLAQRKELSAKGDDASRAALRRLQGAETIGDVAFDAVVIPESGERLKIIAPLLLFYDIDPRKVHALGTVDWDTPETWTEPALVGAWYPAAAVDSHAAFLKAYREAYGQAAPARASLGYDATALAIVLARNGGRDGFTPEALTAANGFIGVDGIFRLAPSGVVERGLAVKEIGSRSAHVVDPAPQTFEKLTN
jgi:ABC-type branched-subunit amino acid transport system substrate-binding protein